MNNFDNNNTGYANIATEDTCCPPPVEPLVAIVQTNTKGIELALSMAYEINGHMFGTGEPSKEQGINPKCFRDVMVKQSQDICDLCNELSKIKERFGI